MANIIRNLRRVGMFLAAVIGLTIAVWNAPEAYVTGCSHWLTITGESEIVQHICQFNPDK